MSQTCHTRFLEMERKMDKRGEIFARLRANGPILLWCFCLHTAGVGGSNPLPPTRKNKKEGRPVDGLFFLEIGTGANSFMGPAIRLQRADWQVPRHGIRIRTVRHEPRRDLTPPLTQTPLMPRGVVWSRAGMAPSRERIGSYPQFHFKVLKFYEVIAAPFSPDK